MIAFENVAYSYGGGDLLSDVSLASRARVVPLSHRAVGVGQVDLPETRLCRASCRPAGQVTLFDRDVTALSRDDVARTRRRIGIVHQDCKFLDHLSLAANMALPFTVVGPRKRPAGPG